MLSNKESSREHSRLSLEGEIEQILWADSGQAGMYDQVGMGWGGGESTGRDYCSGGGAM